MDVLLAAAATLHRSERLPQAIAAYKLVLQQQPEHAHALHMLGMLAQLQDDQMAAVEWIKRAIAIEPTPEMHYNLGVVLQAQKDWKGAALHYNTAIAMRPDYGFAWTNLGSVFKELGFKEATIEAYARAVELQPSICSLHTNLGTALIAASRPREAIDAFQRALSLKPQDAASLQGMGASLMSVGGGQNPEALNYFRASHAADSSSIDAHSNLIFAMDMDPRFDTQALLAERRRWADLHARPHEHKQRAHRNLPDSARRVRVGYVSADFKTHSAPKVFGAMLMHYDRTQYEVFAYSQLDFKSKDDQSYLFAGAVDHWADIGQLSDDELAARIRLDQIDILVDLSGYSSGSRLLTFAQKPAPIQITAWGYASSTGLKAMDVFFSDPVIVPPEEKPWYVEEVRYLPNFLHYWCSAPFPPAAPLPALTNGHITFGSLNRLSKVTDDVWATWAEVLKAVPNSQFLIKATENKDPEDRAAVIRRFERAGIDSRRLILLEGSDWPQHIATFAQVDICLDPFPHGGGVSTLEALKSGVPVVAMGGDTLVKRISLSILTSLDMTDWVAQTPEEYVALAAGKAADVAGLKQLRETLRERFDNSAVGDNKAYVAAVEVQYRQLWQRWCEQQRSVEAPKPSDARGLLAA
ncbi:MAG: tetratricopeptide repeat protein [Betaproteobacteria bacterium]